MSRFNLPVFKLPAPALTAAQLIRRTINADAEADAALGETTTLDFGLAIHNPEFPAIRAANHVTDVVLPLEIPAEEAFSQVETLYAAKQTICLKWMLAPPLSPQPDEPPTPIAAFLEARHWKRKVHRFYTLAQVHPLPVRDNLTVIPIRASFAKLRELIAATSLTSGQSDPLLPLAYERRFDNTHLDGLLALDNTTPVGLVTLYTDGEFGYLADLHVHPAHYRQKIGATLLMRAFELAVRSRHRHVTLYADDDNAPAIALYQRAGFIPVGTADAYYRPA